MNDETDRDLTILAVQGDQDAFGELVRRHQCAVFNAAYRMLGNRHDAEDAAQEAFIRAYRAFDTFETGRPPRRCRELSEPVSGDLRRYQG